MTRARTIEVAALNIAMHAPHSPQAYVDLISLVAGQRSAIAKGEVHYLMLGSVHREGGDELDGLSGEIYRFIKLDPNEPWFNAFTNEEASPEERRRVQIPEYLLPHLQTIPFVFRPRTHRLYYVSHDRKTRLAPSAVKSFLEALFRPLVEQRRFPQIAVTVLPDSEAIERIFTMPKLERLTIELVRPNPDDGEDDEARWLDKLQQRQARKLKVELTAERGQSLVLDDETRSLARVASENGNVLGEGKNAADVKLRESTDEKPLIHFVPVQSELQTVFGVLSDTATLIDAN